MNRAVLFKIEVDCLIQKNWSLWKRADQEHFERSAVKNGVEMNYDPKYDEMTYTGAFASLFHFMYDVAYRYDIEIM